jgi:hypothetical protein
VAGGDLDVAEVNSGVERGGDVGVAEHVRVHTRTSDAGRVCDVAQPTGGAVAVEAVGTPVEQDWPSTPAPGRTLDGTRDGRRERRQDVLVALAAHQQHSVAVFLAVVFDVRSGGLEDPQPEEPKHRNQREVAAIGGVPGRGQDGFELQMGQAQGGRLVGDPRPADVVSR